MASSEGLLLFFEIASAAFAVTISLSQVQSEGCKLPRTHSMIKSAGILLKEGLNGVNR